MDLEHVSEIAFELRKISGLLKELKDLNKEILKELKDERTKNKSTENKE